MGGVKLDVSDLAKPYRDQIRQSVSRLKEKQIDAPLLVGLLSNSDPAAKQYAEWTKRACEADGLRYELRQIADPLDVEATLQQLNDDPNVHGIIVYYPIFGQEESLKYFDVL
jgi:methylenetetrahydrofolate dehydrogenase (NAD+)